MYEEVSVYIKGYNYAGFSRAGVYRFMQVHIYSYFSVYSIKRRQRKKSTINS